MRLGWRLDNPSFRQLFTGLFIPGGTQEQADSHDAEPLLLSALSDISDTVDKAAIGLPAHRAGRSRRSDRHRQQIRGPAFMDRFAAHHLRFAADVWVVARRRARGSSCQLPETLPLTDGRAPRPYLQSDFSLQRQQASNLRSQMEFFRFQNQSNLDHF